MRRKKGSFRVVWDINTKTWVVARADTSLDLHAHFFEKQGCFNLIRMYKKGIIPYKRYFRDAMKRITTEEEFKSFKKE